MTAAPTPVPDVIRAFARPDCPVCGAAGAPLYRDLTDAVWGAPGRWAMVRCPAPECGTLWLDPAPIEEDIALAYARYQTHEWLLAPPPGAARRWIERAKRAYLTHRWGYPEDGPPLPGLAWLLFMVLPQQRARLDSSVFHLRGDRPGRLLDVGCGAGAGLERMRLLGWEVEGVDPDAQAVAVARGRGLRVAHGTLHGQAFAPRRFDAVTMIHVVEHLHDARAVLDECMRVLAPGGRLVVETPNAGAWLHRRFGADWRGLEPPRHLQVFTSVALTRLVRERGFEVVRVFTTAKAAAFFFDASAATLAARRRGVPSRDQARSARLLAGAAAASEWLLSRIGAAQGEELVLVARKPA